jgi:hypothetical protein
MFISPVMFPVMFPCAETSETAGIEVVAAPNPVRAIIVTINAITFTFVISLGECSKYLNALSIRKERKYSKHYAGKRVS